MGDFFDSCTKDEIIAQWQGAQAEIASLKEELEEEAARAEAAEGRVAELELREQAHIGEIEAVRVVWQDYALAPDCELTPDAQEFKRQLREIVGIDAAEKELQTLREGGVSRVEQHLHEWRRGEPLSGERQREVHLVALGALLVFSATRDGSSMVRLHKACGCIVCGAEATQKAAAAAEEVE